ncbi:MAG: DUF1800 domain-containing protein [Pirellulales bacterium]
MPAPADPQPQPIEQADPAWAWASYEPSGSEGWSLDLAAHLYRRAGFSANWSQLSQALNDGCQGTVDRLLSGVPDTDGHYEQAAGMVETLLGSSNGQNLPAWWLHLMVHTPHPLLEKMTLFWHGHFATSAAKVTDPRLMHDQNHLLRTHALGRFGPLLEAMAKNPAMLLWLDSATNRKARPNENFAREVMELFSMGLGNYTERDIKEAARAFTGWEVKHGEFRFNRYEHDPRPKTVLGLTGPWNGDDVIRILLEQPATARFLAKKVYRYLVSETEEPPDSLIEPLADGLRRNDYDMTWLVRTVLSSNLFYSPHGVRQRIKSPLELAVGLLRALEGTANMYVLAQELEALGQAVFFPPNVKGWDGGTTWINSSTLLGRANLVWGLVGREGRYNSKVDLVRLPALEGVDEPAALARRAVELLLGSTLPDEVYVQLTAVANEAGQANSDRRQRLARLVQAVATLPEFQLA